MRFVSFDPASKKNLGWAKLDFIDGKIDNYEAGTLVLDATDEPWQVCWPMFGFVDETISKYQPDLVICERTSAFSGSFITGQISSCMGVIFACCGKYNLKMKQVYPTHVKKQVTGKGKCTKKQMEKAVKNIVKDIKSDISNASEHAYDALANILCYMIDEKLYSFCAEK